MKTPNKPINVVRETLFALFIVVICAAAFAGLGWLIEAFSAIPGALVTIGATIGAVIGVRLFWMARPESGR